MSRKHVGMRKIKEVLRLSKLGLSPRRISESVKIGRTTVQDYLRRVCDAKLSIEDALAISEEDLETLLFGSSEPSSNRPLPCWKTIHKEHRKEGITLQVLWEEYREMYPDGLCYSYFCDLYNSYAKTVDVSMRQTHKAGDKAFIDYCGKTVEVFDRVTNVSRPAYIFVAVLGASNYLYAEATWSQQISDWIASHVRALEFFGGVPRAIVPDNLKSGVTKAWYYDPEINPTYAEFARHYSTAILPARVRKPKDKAKAEAGVQVVQRWLLAKLRHHRFYELADLNQAIRELLTALNNRPFRKLDGTRQSMFESLEKNVLAPLPTVGFEFSSWKSAKVNIDYHVEYKKYLYSVSWREVHQKVRVRATSKTIEIFKGDERIATHLRKYSGDRYSTLEEHMPANHKFMKWPPSKLIEMGKRIGDPVRKVVEEILKSRPHPEQGFRAALGLLRLGRTMGEDRLLNACQRAIDLGSPKYKSVRSILESGLDRQASEDINTSLKNPVHKNIRGAVYYKGREDVFDASATNN